MSRRTASNASTNAPPARVRSCSCPCPCPSVTLVRCTDPHQGRANRGAIVSLRTVSAPLARRDGPRLAAIVLVPTAASLLFPEVCCGGSVRCAALGFARLDYIMSSFVFSVSFRFPPMFLFLFRFRFPFRRVSYECRICGYVHTKGQDVCRVFYL